LKTRPYEIARSAFCGGSRADTAAQAGQGRRYDSKISQPFTYAIRGLALTDLYLIEMHEKLSLGSFPKNEPYRQRLRASLKHHVNLSLALPEK